MKWSPQQQAFLDWCEHGEGSCILEAVAGAGKTTTLIEGARVIPGQVAMIVFNKRNGDELTLKLEAAGIGYDKAQGGTVHSFGFKAYRKQFPGTRVERNKVRAIVEADYGG